MILVFDLDPGQVVVEGFKPQGSLALIRAPTDNALLLGALTGETIGVSGYVGTVSFRTTADLTGLPYAIHVAHSEGGDNGGFTNIPTVVGSPLSFNTGWQRRIEL